MEERELQHFSHEHPLILVVEQSKTNGGNDHPGFDINCNGCSIPISGPFYSCVECRYFLHKVCAELPSALDHPLHPQHPLALLRRSPYSGSYRCNLCREIGSEFVYHCSVCLFDVDMKCASATHIIHDKCHPHPLITVQVPIAFDCHICLKKEEGLSYKCNVCPFWVHQNCTLLPDTVNHSDHTHILIFLPSIPFEFRKVSYSCDICHSKLFMFQCIYGCARCLFFSHVSCARSETIQSPSTSSYQNTDSRSVVHLPMKQDSTYLISRFVTNYIDGDASTDNKINHFDHEHPLIIIDEETTDKTCEACAVRISAPSYGCFDCDYFLHKCCADLPREICHPQHPKHPLVLQSSPGLIRCDCCRQWCTSFIYKCSECFFKMDIKCGSILEGTVVYHEAHKHPLLMQGIHSSSTICTACSEHPNNDYTLQCKICSFELCFECAMAPPVIKHRYGKSDLFRLTYAPPQNHYDEYICEICLKELNPKQWYYHCVFADQFANIGCMILCGADSNIKYGKSFMVKEHEHKVTTIRCAYDCTPCSDCREPMMTGLRAGVGFECKTCNFKMHIGCLGW